MSAATIEMRPRFFGGKGERCFTLQFCCGGEPRADILFIPPFAEEMNRCRSLVAQQARSFAAAGYNCTLLDFVGTGDSDGELSEVRLEQWLRNIALVVDSLRAGTAAPLVLWGMRLGALVAMAYARDNAAAVERMLLWQPVTNPGMYITQVLRQRVATLMMRDQPAETTKEIRQRLADGETVEVAGYTLGGALLDDLEALALPAMGRLCSGEIYWLEHVAEAGRDIALPSRKAVEQLLAMDNSVAVHTFTDPQIWQIHERDQAPNLLALTAGLFA